MVVASTRKLTGQSTEQLGRDRELDSDIGGIGGGNHRNGGGGGGGRGGNGGNGGGSGGSGGPGDRHPRRALVLATLKWSAALAAGAAALLAAAPYALSHPWGLQTMLAVINLAAPPSVSLRIDSLHASWQQPLQIHNLRLIERSGGSSGAGTTSGASFDPSSSEEEDDYYPFEPAATSAAQPTRGLDPAAAAAAAEHAAGPARGLLRRRRRSDGAAPDAAVGTTPAPASGSTSSGAVGSGDGSGTRKRRRVLVSIEQVRTPQTLWQLLRGGKADMIVTAPRIDCTFTPQGQPRLLAVLQQAGWLPEPHPVRQKSGGFAAEALPVGNGGPPRPAPPANPNISDISGTAPSNRAQGSQQETGGASAAGAATETRRAAILRHASAAVAAAADSDSDDDDRPLPSLAEAAAAAAAVAAAATSRKPRRDGTAAGSGTAGEDSLTSAASRQQQQQQQQQEQQRKGGPPFPPAPAGSKIQTLAVKAASVAPLLISPPADSSDSDDEEESASLAAARNRQAAASRQKGAAAVSPVALLGYMSPARRQQQAAAAAAAGRGGGAAAGGTPAGGTPAGGSGSGTGAGSRPGEGAEAGRAWLPESFQHAGASVALSGELRSAGLSVYVAEGALLVPTELSELLGSRVHFEVLRGLPAIEEAAADAQPANGGPAGSGGGRDLKWARQRPAVLLPWGTGGLQTPLSVQLDASHMQFTLQGWQTARGFTYLQRPVEARLEFTPALGRYLFAYLHPALGGTVGLKATTSVAARLAPHDGLWPTRQATLRLEPLTVEVGESPVLRQSAGVLALAAGKLKLSGSLRAELSPLQATLDTDGSLTAERLDIRIGLSPFKAGLHLVSWGTASLKPPQALDATVCIPGDTLAALGLPALPPGQGLPLHVGGTPQQPRVEIASASKQLAVLVAQQQAAKLASKGKGDKRGVPQWLAEQLQQGLGGGEEMVGVPMPPPLA